MTLLLQADRYPLETPEEVPQDVSTQLYFRTCLASRRREGRWGVGEDAPGAICTPSLFMVKTNQTCHSSTLQALDRDILGYYASIRRDRLTSFLLLASHREHSCKEHSLISLRCYRTWGRGGGVVY